MRIQTRVLIPLLTAGAAAVIAAASSTIITAGPQRVSPPGHFARNGVNPAADPTEPPLQPNYVPPIDWDHPLINGSPSTVDAVAGGGLGFVPFIPVAVVAPFAVETAIPDADSALPQAVGFGYHFPAGPGLGADTRVVVVEANSMMTADDLSEILDANAALGDQEVTVGGCHGILAHGDQQGYDVGRIFLLCGRVSVDITGPAVSPAKVLQIAQQTVGATP